MSRSQSKCYPAELHVCLSRCAPRLRRLTNGQQCAGMTYKIVRSDGYELHLDALTRTDAAVKAVLRNRSTATVVYCKPLCPLQCLDTRVLASSCNDNKRASFHTASSARWRIDGAARLAG